MSSNNPMCFPISLYTCINQIIYTSDLKHVICTIIGYTFRSWQRLLYSLRLRCFFKTLSGSLDRIVSSDVFLHITRQTFRRNHVAYTYWLYMLKLPSTYRPHTSAPSPIDDLRIDCLPHRSVGRSMTNVPESISPRLDPGWPHGPIYTALRLPLSPPAVFGSVSGNFISSHRQRSFRGR